MTQNNNVAAGEAAGAVAGGRQQNPAVEVVKAHWRRTRMGGITYPVALSLIGGRLRVLKPIREEYSKTHSHGVWYYPRAVDLMIYLEQSNSGRRSVFIPMCRLPPQLCRAVEEKARAAWVGGFATCQVEEMLEALV